jgi:hypothetical protein
MWRLPPGCTADDLLNARRLATAVVHHHHQQQQQQQHHQHQQHQQVQHSRTASKLGPTAAAAMLYNGLWLLTVVPDCMNLFYFASNFS